MTEPYTQTTNRPGRPKKSLGSKRKQFVFTMAQSARSKLGTLAEAQAAGNLSRWVEQAIERAYDALLSRAIDQGEPMEEP